MPYLILPRRVRRGAQHVRPVPAFAPLDLAPLLWSPVWGNVGSKRVATTDIGSGTSRTSLFGSPATTRSAVNSGINLGAVVSPRDPINVGFTAQVTFRVSSSETSSPWLLASSQYPSSNGNGVWVSYDARSIPTAGTKLAWYDGSGSGDTDRRQYYVEYTQRTFHDGLAHNVVFVIRGVDSARIFVDGQDYVVGYEGFASSYSPGTENGTLHTLRAGNAWLEGAQPESVGNCAIIDYPIDDALAQEWSVDQWRVYESIAPRIYFLPAAGATNLVVADASHAQTADAVTLTQAHSLAVDSATSAHAADALTLSGAADLAIDAASHATTDGGPLALTQAHALATDAASHAQTADALSLGGAAELAIDAAAHTVADGGPITLAQTHALTVADAAHSHAAESPSLVLVFFDYFYPTSDISAGSWTPSTGSTLWEVLDETVADDGDYIQSSLSPSADTCEVAFGTTETPSLDTNHHIAYRCKSDGAVTLDVYLVEGTTVRASWSHAPAPADWTEYDQTLTPAEAAAITDYNNLRLRFSATA